MLRWPPWSRRPEPPTGEPTLLTIARIELQPDRRRCVVDGVARRGLYGSWMVYIPSLRMKLFHARGGRLDCAHPRRPSPAQLESGDYVGRHHSIEDWRAALATPLVDRCAEVYVASLRLAKAGLGPWPRGFVSVGEVVIEASGAIAPGHVAMESRVEPGGTLGLLLDDVMRMPRRPPAEEAEMRQAGVEPDPRRLSLKQQLRGYVIDLNSVRGVMPVDAEDEVRRVKALLQDWRTRLGHGGQSRS